MESSGPGFEEEQDGAGVELEEVRKLQELVRRLEVQNQSLRNRGSKPVANGGSGSYHHQHHHAAGSNGNLNERLSCEGVSHPDLRLDRRDSELSPPQDTTASSCSSEDVSPLPMANRLGEEEEGAQGFGGPCMGFLTLPCGNGPEPVQGPAPESPSQESYDSETLAESDSGVDQTALDEVDVLDLEDECAEVDDEDSWYVCHVSAGPPRLFLILILLSAFP